MERGEGGLAFGRGAKWKDRQREKEISGNKKYSKALFFPEILGFL